MWSLPGQAKRLQPARPLDDPRLSFRFQVGVGVDGGFPEGCTAPNCTAGEAPAQLLNGTTLDEQNLYERIRLYTFGDAVVSTSDLLAPGLHSYLAAKFRIEQTPNKPSTRIMKID